MITTLPRSLEKRARRRSLRRMEAVEEYGFQPDESDGAQDDAARRTDVTALLHRAVVDGEVASELFPLVYGELRAIAARRMSGERAEHTLQATALVHEAYLRLVNDERMDWRGRRHFFGAAAEAMRRVLVDHARKAKAEKRGGDRARLSITAAQLVQEDDDPEALLALDEALGKLEREDPRAAEVARLRTFAGLSVAEVTDALELSERTVMREWAYARARLYELLGGSPTD